MPVATFDATAIPGILKELISFRNAFSVRIGRIRISFLVISDLPDFNLVVLLMGTNPDDEHDLVLIIDGYDQPIIVSPDVEDHALRGDDAGGCVMPLDVCGVLPMGFGNLGVPGVQPPLHRAPQSFLNSVLYEEVESTTRDYSHPPRVA